MTDQPQGSTQTTQQMPKFFYPLQELNALENGVLNPFPFYQKMRETTPVRYDQFRECWDVFGYEDVQRVLQDYACFSSERMSVPQEEGSAMMESLIVMDPPRHTMFRNLVNKAFTPKKIADLAPKIESISNELIDWVIEKGSLELTEDFSSPLPVTVIAELLGVPASERKRFKHWSDVALLGVPAEDSSPEALENLRLEKELTFQELVAYFTVIIEERRQAPQDDLISALIEARIDDDQPLTDQQLIGFCILLLIAGNETTTNLINNMTRYLIENPSLQDELRRNPDLIPSAIEEVLRYYPPVQMLVRKAAQDVELGGQLIRENDFVCAWIASANRDEAKFEQAAAFVPDRHPNQHVTFGFGVHFCLGAPLARLEAQVAMRALIDRLPNLRLQENAVLEPMPSPFIYAIKKVPLLFGS